MPFVSTSQQGWMFANHPKMARRWAHHTKDFKHLPEHVSHSGPDSKEGAFMSRVHQLAEKAFELVELKKLSRAVELPEPLVNFMAQCAGMSCSGLAKAASANPRDFTDLFQVLRGDIHPSQIKTAAPGGAVQNFLQLLRAKGSGALEGAKAFAQKLMGKGPGEVQGFLPGMADSVKGPGMMERAGRIAFGAPKAGPALSGGEQLGRGALLGGGGGIAAGMGLENAMSGSPKPPAPPMSPGGSPSGPTPPPGSPPGGGGGGSGINPALAAGGGALAGGGVMAAMMGRRKKKDEKIASAHIIITRQLLGNVVSKVRQKQAAAALSNTIDVLAKALPIEKTAALRTVQASVSRGEPLAYAIKVAYPHMTGEQRGSFALQLCRAATALSKKANLGMAPSDAGPAPTSKVPSQTMSSYNGPLAGASSFMGGVGS